jgi:hypothetical protein
MAKRPPAPARIQPRLDEIPEPPKSRQPEIRLPDPPKLPPVETKPAAPPGPVRSEPAAPPRPAPAAPEPTLPPVTLQLVKLAIMNDTPAEAVDHVQRLLGCSRPEADRTIRAVLAAFPDVKPKQ